MPTKFKHVKNLTTEEYFNGNQFSIDAFNLKYKLHDDETYVKAIKRVCDEIASVEKTKELQKYWSERWFDEIYNDWWQPAGSIMQGAGNPKNVSLSNCTTLSLGVNEKTEWDNLESIFRNTGYSVAKCAAYRQGLGVDFSKLRPRGTQVGNSANESTGAVHWMGFIDSIAKYVGQKGRIPAMLFSLHCSHPDIEEFITLKKDYTVVQNANISVQCSDNFYKAVEEDREWDLTFTIPAIKKGDHILVDNNSFINGPNAYHQAISMTEAATYHVATKDRKKEVFTKKIKAKDLLELIAKNMCWHGEPGIQNIDIASYWSNSDYLGDEYKIISTNACSEQYLNRDGLCVLSSINAEKFSVIPDELRRQMNCIGQSVQRFLDNVVEYELVNLKYATPHQERSLKQLRRIGAGYTNLCAWLLKKGVSYGQESGNIEAEEFTKEYTYSLYRWSIETGKEKGSFGAFDREKLEKAPFIQKMMELGLEFKALRNVTLVSIAPVGTVTLMLSDAALSYGIEPAFGLYFWKRTRISGEYKYYFCVPNIVRKLYKDAGFEIPIDRDIIEDEWDGKHGKPIAKFIDTHKDDVNINFLSATDISTTDKLDLMSRVAKWVDSSISTTYLLKEGADWKNIYDFILETNRKQVKSVAAFPDRKMYGIISFTPFKDLAVKLTNEGIVIDKSNFSDNEAKFLEAHSKYNLVGEHIIANHAPKRPKKLKCDIHHIRITKKLDKVRTFDYAVVVGLLNNIQPYEVFVLENSEIPKNATEGKINKYSKGRYDIELNDGTIIKDITQGTTEEEDAITRLTSTCLRHGSQVDFVANQLSKSRGDIYAFAKAISRVLKTYIKDGARCGECPDCQADMQYVSGCATCTKCGYSKCE